MEKAQITVQQYYEEKNNYIYIFSYKVHLLGYRYFILIRVFYKNIYMYIFGPINDLGIYIFFKHEIRLLIQILIIPTQKCICK